MNNTFASVPLRWVCQTLLILALSPFLSQSFAINWQSNAKEKETSTHHQFCNANQNNKSLTCINRSTESEMPGLVKRRKSYSNGSIYSIGSLGEGVTFQRNSDGSPVEVLVIIKMLETQPLEYQIHHHNDGRKTSWRSIAAISNNIARSQIKLPAGLHTVEIRNANSKTILERIENIKVGDVFAVISLQGYSDTKQLSSSPWPFFANFLAECTKLPVHIIDAGGAGSLLKELDLSSVGNQQKNNFHLARLKHTIRLLREYNGVRSFFWTHGTHDAFDGTSSQNYEKSLSRLIQLSRRELQQELPWFVSLSSNSDTLTSQSHGQDIISAQLRVIQNHELTFLGSETDKYFLHDKLYPMEPRLLSKDLSEYSQYGHQEQGKEWFNRLKESGLISEMAHCAMKKVSYSVPKSILTNASFLDLSSVKGDKQPPVMSLEPDVRIVEHVINRTFRAPEINCIDNVDGRVEPTEAGHVDLQIAGVYRKKILCRDSAGNEVNRTLTVVVRDAKTGSQFVVTTATGQMVNSLAASQMILANDELPVTVVSSLNFTDKNSDSGHFSDDRSFPNISDMKQNFALKAKLKFKLVSAGNYIIGTLSDDGVMLHIDGKPLIFDDNLHSEQNNIIDVYLSAGDHTLELIFFDAGGSASLELFGAPGVLRPGTFFEDYDLKLLSAPINGKLFEE